MGWSKMKKTDFLVHRSANLEVNYVYLKMSDM